MHRSVMIVENGRSNGTSIAQLVGDRFDVVRTVATALEAAELAVELRPTIVITPFPAVTPSGELLTALLKRDPRTAACRIIAYSDWAWANTRAKALEEGCEAFVPTDGPIEDLVAEIDRLLDGTTPRAPEAPDSIRTALFD